MNSIVYQQQPQLARPLVLRNGSVDIINDQSKTSANTTKNYQSTNDRTINTTTSADPKDQNKQLVVHQSQFVASINEVSLKSI